MNPPRSGHVQQGTWGGLAFALVSGILTLLGAVAFIGVRNAAVDAWLGMRARVRGLARRGPTTPVTSIPDPASPDLTLPDPARPDPTLPDPARPDPTLPDPAAEAARYLYFGELHAAA